MSSRRSCKSLSAIESQVSRQSAGRTRIVASTLSARLLLVIMVVVALTTAADLWAIAQDSSGTQLQRVDIDPPERRARSRDVSSTQAPSSEDPGPSDRAPSDASSAAAQTGSGSLSTMPSLSIVTDKSSVSSVGAAALPSQVTVVTRREIERLDVRNYTDLLRTVPGVRAFSYGQGDIGHPMQIRGNSGGHGVDTCIYVDGVPQNFASASQGGNGMSDISWLTPEMIDRIEVIKGPFSVLYGNIAQAGVINIITKTSEPTPSVTLSGASFGCFRAVPIITSEAWSPTPFVVNELMTLDGYNDNSQYKRWSSFNKVTAPFWNGALSLRFNYYTSQWGAPGYQYIDYVQKGLVDRRSAVDPTDYGNQRTWSAVANYAPVGCDAGLYFTAYVENYKKSRWAAFLPGPVQRLQEDDRLFYGGRIFYNLVFGNFASVMFGAESRYDRGTAVQFPTVNRETTGTTNYYDLGLLNTALFVQGQIKLADPVKLVGGVRKDFFDDNVDNRLTPRNSGKGYPTTVSPKAGFVLTPFKNVNIFGNKGLGFRAPAASEMSPATGTKTNFQLGVAQTDSWDLGFNALFIDQIYIALDWYRTDMQNEIRLTTAGDPINVGNSKRTGYEVEVRYYPTNQVNVFANYSWVDAKVKNPATAGQDLVTGIAQDVIKAGIGVTYDLTPDVKFLGDFYGEYVGEQPYYFGTNPTPQYGPDYVLYAMKFAWQGKNWGVFASGKYQPKELSSNNVSSGGSSSAGYHFTFTPLPLWDLNGGIKYTF
jgi:outer membrane receptor protein involved in Fe transport